MRRRRAVEKLRILAETCERVKLFWFDTEPSLKAGYAFGEVLDGAGHGMEPHFQHVRTRWNRGFMPSSSVPAR